MLVANFLRKKSKKIVSQKPEYIMDVNLDTVKKYFEINDLDIIIHGHTHRINTHKVIVNNDYSGPRITIGFDILDEPSVPDDSFSLIPLL